MRDHILKNAVDLFRQYGYTKTTLTDIARSVGKVKSAIYYYFGGKEEIFASIVQLESKEFFEQLVQELETTDHPERKIQLYIEKRIFLMQKVADRYSFLKSELFKLLPLLELNRKEYLQKEVELLTEVIAQFFHEQNENIDHQTIKFKANLLVSTLKGMEIEMYVTNERTTNNHEIEAFKSFLLYGLLNNVKQIK